MQLSLAISPCPNDTFIFDALVNNKIDTKGFSFDLHLADVEELNQSAFNNQFDITKLSYHALSNCLGNYDLLDAGSALGRNCGPLLISRLPYEKNDLIGKIIAIPGEWTTANFLLTYFDIPKIEIKEYLFSDIEAAIKTGQVDAGVIIHENRFTYADRGFRLVQDLGAYWELKSGYPIPLGGIAIKKNLDQEVKQSVNSLIFESLQYAMSTRGELPPFVLSNAQEMEETVMRKHIDLYVNKFSLSLGEEGFAAIIELFSALKSPPPTLIK